MLDITRPIWPEKVPGFGLGWKHQGLGDNVLRSKPERGPAKTRRTATAPVETISGTIAMDAAAYRIFTRWFHDEIADGAMSFQWWNFLKEDWCEARITSTSAESDGRVAGDMSVTLTLEVLP